MGYESVSSGESISVIFHDAATVAANGTALKCGAFRSLTVEIDSAGGNSARTVTFYGKGPSGTLRALPGCKMTGDTNFTMALSTTGTGEIWQFDITGLEHVIMDLTSITGGNVSVKGKAVA
jgi:hypothetical protein